MFKNDYKMFDRARSVALASTFYKTRVGCVAVYHGTVIAVGCNAEKTHPTQKMYNKYREQNQDAAFIPKIHAEIACLNALSRMNIDQSKVRLYIYRVRKDGTRGLSRPCPSCMAAIRAFGIKQIFYSTNDGYASEEIERAA